MKKKFFFSTSSNSFQFEGGRSLGGRTDSIWDEFTKRNFYIPPVGSTNREINSIETAADFFHKYKTDIRIMKNANINAFAYNMDWTRIFPKDEYYINPEGIKWHEDVFSNMKENGITPIPILFHWDHPVWAQIRGGWENQEILSWFRNYVKTCFKYLGKYTNYWFVNDENSSFSISGHLNFRHPPQRGGAESFVKALHNLNMSAAIAKEEFLIAKEKGYVDKDAVIGIDHDWSPPIPIDDSNESKEACNLYNTWFKDLFFNPNLKGEYPKEFIEYTIKNNVENYITKDDLNYLKKFTMDWIGWNYYRPAYIGDINFDESKIEIQKSSETFFGANFKLIYPSKNVRYTKWNWVIDPSKLYEGLNILGKEYKVPMMIIENGYGDFDDKTNDFIEDDDRISYLKEHLDETLRAFNDGINVIGYSLWTYCDIFSPSAGYRKDYGLVSVDFNSPIKIRKPKLSYAWYKQVCSSGGDDTSFNKKKLKKELIEIIEKWDYKFK